MKRPADHLEQPSFLYAGLLSLGLHALLLRALWWLPAVEPPLQPTPAPLMVELEVVQAPVQAPAQAPAQSLGPTTQAAAPSSSLSRAGGRVRVSASATSPTPSEQPVGLGLPLTSAVRADPAPALFPAAAATPPSTEPGPSHSPLTDPAPVQDPSERASIQLDPTRALGTAGWGSGAAQHGAPGTNKPESGSGNGSHLGGDKSDATGSGRGVLSEAEVKAQFLQLGRETRGRDKASRGLYSKTLIDYSTRMEARWDVRQAQVDHYPVKPQVRSGLRAAHGVEDSRPSWSRGDDLSTPCYFERYSLGQVRLVLKASGELEEVSLYRSSGSIRLDREALRLVRGAAPYPAPEAQDLGPDGLSRMVWDVGVRNYSNSNCKPLDRKYLIKDIELVMVE